MLKEIGLLLAEMEDAAGGELLPSGDRVALQRKAALLRKRIDRVRTRAGNGLLRELPRQRRAAYEEVFQQFLSRAGRVRS